VPPTTAPPPTFAEAVGKAASAIRASQSAFKSGDYDHAVAQAQAALREDPGNTEAQRVLNNALEGQKATTHFRTAEAALARGDFAQANSEAEAGRAAAPWDSRGPSLLTRIGEAQARAQQAAAQQAEQQKRAAQAAQLNDLLGKADGALQAQKYDEAIAFYDQALGLDAGNQRALNGKSSSVQARALALAAAAGGGGKAAGGHSFVMSKTSAQSTETIGSGGAPPGFEGDAGVVVKKGTQAADLPGKIDFEIDPEQVKPGEKYTVKVYLRNEGGAPIDVASLLVTTTVNGRKVSGPVPSLVKEVAPRQKGMLLLLPDFWKEDTSSWAMEVTVRTARGETYKNQVAWR
jgi:tetratricopeptide (TPR) repeat protein